MNSEISALWEKINKTSDKKNIHSTHCFAEGIVFYQTCMVLATSIEKRE